MKTTSSVDSPLRIRPQSLLSATFGFALLAASIPANAATLYWNKTSSTLTWASSNNANWADSADATTGYVAWAAGSDAEIVTANALITLGGTAISVGNLTVRNGATFTGTTSYSTTVNISGTGGGEGGGGDFTLADIAGGGAKARIAFTATTTGDGYNGTITVNSFTEAFSGLVLGGTTKPASPPPRLAAPASTRTSSSTAEDSCWKEDLPAPPPPLEAFQAPESSPWKA